MRLYEIARTDSKDKLMKVKDNLLALIAHPTTEPTVRDNAIAKLKVIQQQITAATLATSDGIYDRRPAKTQASWVPKIISISRSGYESSFNLENSNLAFVDRDGTLIRYHTIFIALKPYRPDTISFGPADPSSNSNAVFDPRSRPSFTVSYDNTEHPPHPDLIGDAIRQVTGNPWDVHADGKIFTVKYQPNTQSGYRGPRSSS